MRCSTAAALALVTCGSALAEPVRNPKLGQQKNLDRLAKPQCMCRLRNGTRVPLGTRTCISVGARSYTAECRLSLNVSTWREIADGCPSS